MLLIHNVDELFLALKNCKVISRLMTASGHGVRAAACSRRVCRSCAGAL